MNDATLIRIVVFVWIVVGAIWLVFYLTSERRRNRRKRDLRSFAKRGSFTYEESKRLLGFPFDVFCEDKDNKPYEVFNVMHGTYRGVELYYFELEDPNLIGTPTDDAGEGLEPRSSVCVYLAKMHLPNTLITPRKTGDIVDLFQSKEANLAVRIYSAAPDFPPAVCHERTIEFILARRGWTILIDEGFIAIHCFRAWYTEDLTKAFDFPFEFLSFIPDSVWQHYGGMPPELLAGIRACDRCTEAAGTPHQNAKLLPLADVNYKQ